MESKGYICLNPNHRYTDNGFDYVFQKEKGVVVVVETKSKHTALSSRKSAKEGTPEYIKDVLEEGKRVYAKLENEFITRLIEGVLNYCIFFTRFHFQILAHLILTNFTS